MSTHHTANGSKLKMAKDQRKLWIVANLLTLSLLRTPQEASAAERRATRISSATLVACQNLASYLKPDILGDIQVTNGPFDTVYSQTIPNGCSFVASVKPKRSAPLEKSFVAGWQSLYRYDADGPRGTSYVRQNANTVCFINEQWDSLGDDATEEEIKTWKPKPGSIRIGCADKLVFEPIDNRKDR